MLLAGSAHAAQAQGRSAAIPKSHRGRALQYRCTILQEPGTGTSKLLQEMFDAWAKTVGLQLFPGTVYLCADDPVQLPSAYIPLAEFEHLHEANHRRAQAGYSPRLYPIALAGALLAWVFRWSEDDVKFRFIGNHSTCPAPKLLEVVAPCGVKKELGNLELSLDFIAD